MTSNAESSKFETKTEKIRHCPMKTRAITELMFGDNMAILANKEANFQKKTKILIILAEIRHTECR